MLLFCSKVGAVKTRNFQNARSETTVNKEDPAHAAVKITTRLRGGESKTTRYYAE